MDVLSISPVKKKDSNLVSKEIRKYGAKIKAWDY